MNETLNKLKEKVKIERRYLIPGASVGILLAVILLWALITKIFIPGNRYNGAAQLLQAGKYQQAMESFTALGDFRDAPEQVKACRYAYAGELLNQGLYDEATAQVKMLGDYEDSRAQISQVRYEAAEELLDEGKYDEAATAF